MQLREGTYVREHAVGTDTGPNATKWRWIQRVIVTDVDGKPHLWKKFPVNWILCIKHKTIKSASCFWNGFWVQTGNVRLSEQLSLLLTWLYGFKKSRCQLRKIQRKPAPLEWNSALVKGETWFNIFWSDARHHPCFDLQRDERRFFICKPIAITFSDVGFSRNEVLLFVLMEEGRTQKLGEDSLDSKTLQRLESICCFTAIYIYIYETVLELWQIKFAYHPMEILFPI